MGSCRQSHALQAIHVEKTLMTGYTSSSELSDASSPAASSTSSDTQLSGFTNSLIGVALSAVDVVWVAEKAPGIAGYAEIS